MSLSRRDFLITVIAVPTLEFNPAWSYRHGEPVEVWIPPIADLMIDGSWNEGTFNLVKQQIDIDGTFGGAYIPLNGPKGPLQPKHVRRRKKHR
jgi:hypothetical protein